jgi:uncharacterized protein
MSRRLRALSAQLAAFLLLALAQPLILAGSNINRSALHVAAESGDLPTVMTSLRAGAALEDVDWTNETPLRKAARFGRTEVVAALLQAGATVQVQQSLPVAARYGHGAVVRLLVAAGAEPGVEDTWSFQGPGPDVKDHRIKRLVRHDTPLMIASTYGQTEAVQALLDGGAQPNAQNAIGRTALSCAAIEGHADTVAALLGGGAEVDLQDEKGYVPLMFASTGGHERAVQALLDGGAFVDRATDDGFTAVMIASMHGSLAVTKLLLGAGANPNARTYGIFATSLFNMVVRNTSESNVLHVLGAVAENNVGFTSLMGAATMAYNEIVTVLLRAGAITDTRDNSGWTAHDAAMYNRYATTASLLAAVRVPDEAVVQHNVTDPVQAVHCGLCVDSH